jgi:4'-phosphopantetheinyl transferase
MHNAMTTADDCRPDGRLHARCMDAQARHADGSWPPLEPDRRPVPDAVLVVAVDLDGMDADASMLDEHERRRAERFRDPRLRRRHVAAHHALRRLVGWWLEVPPQAVIIVTDPRGKPALGDRRLSFSLSHSGGWALIALTADGMVGVDVEFGERLHDVDQLAGRVVDQDALGAFSALPQERRTAAFLTTWVRKEAALKAIGLGLPGGMEHVRIGHDPLRLRGDFIHHPDLARLHLHDLPAVDGAAAALCQGPDLRTLMCRAWPVGAQTSGPGHSPDGSSP